MNDFDPSVPVSDGLARYYVEARLDAKQTYVERWAKIKFGPITFYIPNSDQRKRALKVHDIHHVVTGFKPDPQGEAQISAWEIGSGGCGKNFFVWTIILTGALVGLLICPVKTIKAFFLGTKCKNLFGEEPDRYYSLSIGEARQQLGLTAGAGSKALL